MRFIYSILFAVLCARLASANFALVQEVTNTASASCNGSSGTTCTLTVASTGAGHLLVFEMLLNGNISISGASGGGAWVHPAGAQTYNSALNVSVDFVYVLSSAAGATSVVVTIPTSNASRGGFFWEFSFTAPSIALDAVGTPAYNTGLTATAPGIALALTGSNDVVFQGVDAGGTYASVSGGYLGYTTAGGRAGAYLANTASGAAPTWTCTGAIGTAAATAIAFREVSAAMHNSPAVVL